jgi:hypothetical protein
MFIFLEKIEYIPKIELSLLCEINDLSCLPLWSSVRFPDPGSYISVRIFDIPWFSPGSVLTFWEWTK